MHSLAASILTLVADGYTAFAHEEKPTTDEQALEEQEQRAKMTQNFSSERTRDHYHQ